MITGVYNFTIAVRNQEEAVKYYTEVLGFEKRSDNPMGEGRRWVTIAPQSSDVEFVLQPLDWFQEEEQEERIERIGKSPTIVLSVDNCRETYASLSERGVEFTELPNNTFYGVQAILKDIYGNTLVLLERSF